ncbi:hypothetical protein BH09ACT5_BH09ACT5_05370 [soil metagenome]
MTVESIRSPVRRRRWIVAAGALAFVTIAGSLWYQSQASGGRGPRLKPTTSAIEAPGATGCLVAGQDVQMLLGTKGQAAQTPAGAAEFAAALLRWFHQYPNPTGDAAKVAQQEVLASTATYDPVAGLANNPNTSLALVPNGTAYHVTTTHGEYLVEAFDDTSARVLVGGAVVVDGQADPQLELAVDYTIVWEGGAWRFESARRADRSRLAVVGTNFTNGC